LAAAALVDVPDASRVFNASFVTYANEAKMKYLGVEEETIGKFGVVSEEVAGQMARGCARMNEADVGVGISGIAGPGGGTEKKPVGMVCFGFFHDGKTETFTRYFGEIGRNAVRQNSVEFVYDHLFEIL
jgi:nicotinamide-nucleotide amidase